MRTAAHDPLGIAAADLSEEACRRQSDIAVQVVNVVAARALTPAERLMVLTMAAATIVAGACADDEERARALEFTRLMFDASVQGACAAQDVRLASMAVEGRA